MTKRIIDLEDAELPLKRDNLFFHVDSTKEESHYSKLSAIYKDSYLKYIDISGIGTMAYEQSSDYALLLHDHDNYTNINFAPSYPDGKTIISIDVDENTKIYINMPTNDILQQETPTTNFYIGQMKFTYGPIRTVDINSSSFDGWVYADGKQYDAGKFVLGSQLWKYLPSQEASVSSFTVPLVSSSITFGTDIDNSQISDMYIRISDSSQTAYNGMSVMVYVGNVVR